MQCVIGTDAACAILETPFAVSELMSTGWWLVESQLYRTLISPALLIDFFVHACPWSGAAKLRLP